jgi:F0F1-type ATP synthase membrane subunit b/b'
LSLVCSLANIDICWINILIEKFAWKPILDAVNDREELNALLSAENARKEMQNLHADNQRILRSKNGA